MAKKNILIVFASVMSKTGKRMLPKWNASCILAKEVVNYSSILKEARKQGMQFIL